eukprot:1182548-Prorocentrum_minimum.AAC.3
MPLVFFTFSRVLSNRTLPPALLPNPKPNEGVEGVCRGAACTAIAPFRRPSSPILNKMQVTKPASYHPGLPLATARSASCHPPKRPEIALLAPPLTP